MTLAPPAASRPDFPKIPSVVSPPVHAGPASTRLPLPLPLALLLGALLLGAALAGCGKSLPTASEGRGAEIATVPGTGALAASGLATKNTTRLGGAEPIADAAAVALAVYPGLTAATRPATVVLVDARDWTAALAASALAGSALGAPLLYSEGDTLPAISGEALRAMRPSGAPLLQGAQVIEIGTSAAPAGYRTRTLSAGATGEATLAARVERLVAIAHGAPPRRVIVVGADGPRALAMPAAGLAAESGTPILPVDAAGIPAATRRVLAGLRRPIIYAVGPPAAVSDAVLAKLSRFGPVRRIAGEPVATSAPPATGATGPAGPGVGTPAGGGGTPAGGGGTPAGEAVANAIAVARYSDGSFGWGIEEPGHGLVFANASRPLDAPAAASLSASGDYGPLLLLEAPGPVPHALSAYLSDIQPSYPEYQPARGFYNHGWLIGGEGAITVTAQAELDAMLETLPHGSTSTTPTSTTTSTTPPTSTTPTSTTSSSSSPTTSPTTTP
jgi:hypothetical protein